MRRRLHADSGSMPPRIVGPGGAAACRLPCATMSTLTYYRTSRSLNFPFWAVCSLLEPNRRFDLSVGTWARVQRIACRLFVVPLNSASLGVSQAEGEGAPGPTGPVHLGCAAWGPARVRRPHSAESPPPPPDEECPLAHAPACPCPPRCPSACQTGHWQPPGRGLVRCVQRASRTALKISLCGRAGSASTCQWDSHELRVALVVALVDLLA